MLNKSTKTSYTLYFFIFLLFAGSLLFLASLFLATSGGLLNGFRQISIGLFLIGAGEWINHPLPKKLAFTDEEHSSSRKLKHRKRNPTAAGNLLVIVGLILIFTGIADYL